MMLASLGSTLARMTQRAGSVPAPRRTQAGVAVEPGRRLVEGAGVVPDPDLTGVGRRDADGADVVAAADRDP